MTPDETEPSPVTPGHGGHLEAPHHSPWDRPALAPKVTDAERVAMLESVVEDLAERVRMLEEFREAVSP